LIIWLTGLSSSGKTTLGRHVYDLWRAEEANTVIIDGDEIRNVIKSTTSDTYSMEGRRTVAGHYCDLCAWLDRQDINVVCCTISSFEDLRARNRETLSKYFEVYIEVPMEVLYRRDSKNLYAPALAGEIKNVVGVDLAFSPPSAPDMVVDNSQDRDDLKPLAADILNRARTLTP
jgi:adenylylsulfate kinase